MGVMSKLFLIKEDGLKIPITGVTSYRIEHSAHQAPKVSLEMFVQHTHLLTEIDALTEVDALHDAIPKHQIK